MLLPYKIENRIEAGCDEAGRGCLAGAVYAAAVILPPTFQDERLNDSKRLSEKQRYALRPVIEQNAIAWAVGIVTPEEIDECLFSRHASRPRRFEYSSRSTAHRRKPFRPLPQHTLFL